MVPEIDGAVFMDEWKDALWDRFHTGAPLRLRQTVAKWTRRTAVKDIPTFALVPDELPFAVIVRADTRRPKIRAIAKGDLDPSRVAAVVRGPLRLLAALADGRQDGDTLFFSRRIAIEGIFDNFVPVPGVHPFDE